MFVLDDDLRQSIIGQLDMSLLGHQQVLWFELAIDHAKPMQDADANYYLSDDASDECLGEGYFLSAQVEVELAHGQVLHDDVDVSLVLEGLANAH